MELEIRIKDASEIKSIMQECFAADKDLLNKWHISAPASLEVCVEKTFNDMKKVDSSFQFFVAFVQGTLVGYWGVESGCYMNLIFVKPEYRNKEFLTLFWNEIEARMGDRFYTAIYSKNKPANDFYSKLGTTIDTFELDGHPAVIFMFNKKETRLCQ